MYDSSEAIFQQNLCHMMLVETTPEKGCPSNVSPMRTFKGNECNEKVNE